MKKAAAKRTPARVRAAEKVRVSRSEGATAEEARAQQRRAEDMMRPTRCRAFMRRELAHQFPQIVDGFVKAAKTGSVPHVKLATELLKPTRKPPTRRRGTVVAKLMEKLRRNEPFAEPAETVRWPTAEERGAGIGGT